MKKGGDAAAPKFVVEAALHSKGSPAASHILVAYGPKWVTLSLGEAQEGAKDVELAVDSDDPVPVDVGTFSGLILAVRCRDGKEAKIEVEFLVYRARDGKIIGKEKSKASLDNGASHDVPLPW
ncbi:MAG TPA: hypothetical protein VFS19_01475 [Planctomycetota bacterium]|nr:hypothetical protein [Planctomycetota bacterium]